MAGRRQPRGIMNPEFRRLLWLEATPQRLWLIPVALLGATLVLDRAIPAAIPAAALLAFAALTIVWGARQARAAVIDEVRAHTWDIQRMSALSAWPMTWGKLAGATLMPWYAGFVCLGVHAAYRGERDLEEVAGASLVLILAALVAQAVALTTALVGVHRERGQRTRLGTPLVLLLLALVVPTTFGLAMPDGAAAAPAAINWYGWQVSTMPFLLVLLALLAGWAVLGAYRSMCIELQIRTTPWAWLGFALFLALLVAGLAPPPAPAALAGLGSTTALYATLLAYVAGFAFARDPVQYRRVLQALAEGRVRRALEELPLWLSSVLFALGFALAAALFGSDPAISNERPDNLGVVALAVVVMAVRDLALLTWLSFRDGSRRAELVTLVSIAMLNRVIPATLAFAGLDGVAGLVHPPLFDAPLTACAILLVHVVVACMLASAAWRRAMPVLNSPGDRRS